MADELRTVVGSADQIPVIVNVNGVDQTSGFKVKLIPFETGVEAIDLTDGPDWVIAPPSAASYPLGYYCIYSATGTGSERIVDHVGHLRIVSR